MLHLCPGLGQWALHCRCLLFPSQALWCPAPSPNIISPLAGHHCFFVFFTFDAEVEADATRYLNQPQATSWVLTSNIHSYYNVLCITKSTARIGFVVWICCPSDPTNQQLLITVTRTKLTEPPWYSAVKPSWYYVSLPVGK